MVQTLAASGRITLTKGTVITAPNYTLILTDVSPDVIKIVVESSPTNPSNYYTLSNQSEQLLHFKIDITNLSGNTDIEFDEPIMQGLSEYFNAQLANVQSFETVKASDKLDIDINGLSCNCSLSNVVGNSWYYKGNLKYSDYQQDVYVFRLNSKQAYTGQLNTSIVDSTIFYDATGLKFNVLLFNKSSTPSDRDLVKNQIRNSVEFEFEFPVITAFPNADYFHKEWMFSNDIINIGFIDPNPDQQIVQYLANKYALTIDHEPSPSLPKGGSSWTYAYKIKVTGCNCRNAIDIAREIYQNESNIIKFAEPWLEPSAEPITTNDPYFPDSWHITNTGQCLGMTVGGAVIGHGTPDADCDIEEAWNLGHTGSGIKVAVIDKGLYDDNHSDISSKYINGYDYIDNDNDLTSSGISPKAHGQACAGLIAASGNNNIGVVGVAYDAQIVPIITWFGTAYKGFQHALDSANADVVSISMGAENYSSQAIENDISLCKTLGRGGKGIVVVSTAGNADSISTNFFPGNLDDVIGVIASNPDDERKSKTDSWDSTYTWGSNYGSKFDIAAPGTHLITTDLAGSIGYNFIVNDCPGKSNLTNDYTYFSGTSASAPIVAGAAAVLLSANPNLTAVQVQNTLENTADKVGGYDYNAVSIGRSLEMGYGRLNLHAAILMSNTQSINNNSLLNIYPNPAQNYAILEFTLEQAENIDIIIYDYLGRIVSKPIQNQFFIAKDSQMHRIETSSLDSGLYIVALQSENILQTAKLTIVK